MIATTITPVVPLPEYVCMYECMYVCVYVFVCMYVFVCICNDRYHYFKMKPKSERLCVALWCV